MNNDDMPDLSELYGEFISENKDIIKKLTTDLVSLENSPHDSDLISSLFRSAHTLKGNAGFLGLDALGELAHKMENVLDKLRDGEFTFFPEINDVFFRAIDAATVLLEDFMQGKGGERDISGIVADIESLMDGPPDSGGEDVERSMGNPLPDASGLKGKEDSFMRVNTQRLDGIVNLVGELVTGRSRLMEISNRLKNEELADICAYIKNVSTRLQDEVLSIRMVPIKELFNRFFRLVRETSRSLGKDVRLVVKGEDTELDKSIIEFLYDPLVHLIRNSIGHGLEDDREGAGKVKSGTITLDAYHEHNSIHIKVSDDGRGLNVDQIRSRAVEKGLVSREDADSLSDGEAARMIFESGFSTADVVDSISGRGVGMDVVKANIEKIGGYVGLEWEEGKGMTVTIKAPLTLAIVQLFLVRQGRHIFGIPMPYVDETIMVADTDMEYMKGQMVYLLRHKAVPVIRAADLFELESSVPEGEGRHNVVILAMMDMRAGVIVDEFMGKVETVIKPLGRFIDRLPEPLPGISGVSILGSGEIVLVLDVPDLWKML